MRLHKRFALGLAAVLLLSLCACAKTNTPAVTTTPSTTTAAPTTSTPPETTVPTTTEAPDPNDWIVDEELRDYTGTVRFGYIVDLSPAMQGFVDEFNAYYPNIAVEWTTYSNSPTSGMPAYLALVASQLDVICTFGLNYLSAYWDDGLFLDITDKLAEEGIDLIETWGTDVYSYNGRYYSIPCGGLQYYVAINMAAWEEAELGDIPTEWTWGEYIEACRKMTKYNEDGSVAVYGGSSYSSVNTIMYCYAQVYGGDLYFSADGTKSSYSEPIVLQALERQLQAEMTEQIWFPLKTYRAEGIKSYDLFLKGQIASTVECLLTRFIQDSAYDETRNFITAFAPFPTEEKDQTNYMAGVHHYSHIAIAINCRDETAAWLFAKFAATYGAKYLAIVGHQSTWRGTTADDIISVAFGSEENAANYVDLESFKNVVGRVDVPYFVEDVSEYSIAAKYDVRAMLNDPILRAANGMISAEQCLKEAAQHADVYIEAALQGN